MPDGFLLKHSLPICQSTVMTPIRLAEGRKVTCSAIGFNRYRSPCRRDTGETDVTHLDDYDLDYDYFIISVMPWNTEMMLKWNNISRKNDAKYRNTWLILICRLSDGVMNDIASFWMTNYEKWRCPLIWLISSGQMFECLIRHFSRQTRTVICPASYLDLCPSTAKPAGSRLASKCPLWACVCMGGWLEGLAFSSSAEMRWKGSIFYGWSSPESSKDESLCCERKSQHLQRKVNNSNSICHGLHGCKITTFFLLKAYSCFTLTAAYFSSVFSSWWIVSLSRKEFRNLAFAFLWSDYFNSDGVSGWKRFKICDFWSWTCRLKDVSPLIQALSVF